MRTDKAYCFILFSIDSEYKIKYNWLKITDYLVEDCWFTYFKYFLTNSTS